MSGRVLGCVLAVLTFPVAKLSAQDCKPEKDLPAKTTTYDLSTGTIAGETLRGPRTIRATGINTIRYDYEFGSSASYGAAPDLWTGLTSLALTQVTPSAAAVPDPGVRERLFKAPANTRAPGSPAATDLLAAIKNANEQLEANANERLETIQSLRRVQVRVTKMLNDLSSQTMSLHQMQIQANTAIALVAQAKISLTNYLQASTNDISDLVQTTDVEIDSKSDFEQGVHAVWPGAQDTTLLSQSLAGSADSLAAEMTASAIYLPTLTTPLKISETSLRTALVTLTKALATYNTHPKPDASVLKSEQTAEADLQAALLQLTDAEKFLNGLSSQLTIASAQSASAVTAAAALLPQSPIFVAFASDQEILLRWNAKMDSKLTAWNARCEDATQPNPFAKSADPSTCEFGFSTTKDTVVTLTRLDLTPGVQNPTPQTMLTVKVECTSPFSIAAGVVFSTIPDRSFSIAATPITPATTPPTTQNTFTQTEGSNFHPLPLAMIHVRLAEWNEHFALYGSFGVAANIRSSTSGGSAAEYLVGPSIGFFRTAFITAGVHLGNEPNIGNGYTVGEVVPVAVTAVPITTTYRPGFGLGITFTKP